MRRAPVRAGAARVTSRTVRLSVHAIDDIRLGQQLRLKVTRFHPIWRFKQVRATSG